MRHTADAVDYGCRIIRHTIAPPGHMLVRPRQYRLAGSKTGGVELFDVENLRR